MPESARKESCAYCVAQSIQHHGWAWLRFVQEHEIRTKEQEIQVSPHIQILNFKINYKINNYYVLEVILNPMGNTIQVTASTMTH